MDDVRLGIIAICAVGMAVSTLILWAAKVVATALDELWSIGDDLL